MNKSDWRSVVYFLLVFFLSTTAAVANNKLKIEKSGGGLACLGLIKVGSNTCKNRFQRRARAYPICFYEERLSDKKLDQWKIETTKFVKVYLGEKAGIQFSADGRWMTARAADASHLNLRSVWSRVGCVGSYRDDQQYVYYRRCVAYLNGMLKNWAYDYMGEKYDGTEREGQLFCGGK